MAEVERKASRTSLGSRTNSMAGKLLSRYYGLNPSRSNISVDASNNSPGALTPEVSNNNVSSGNNAKLDRDRSEQEAKYEAMVRLANTSNGGNSSQPSSNEDFCTKVRRMRKSFFDATRIIGSRPFKTLTFPLILFTILVTGGVIGVVFGARAMKEGAREKARNNALQVSESIRRNLEVNYAPIVALGAFITLEPDWSFLSTNFDQLCTQLTESNDLIKQDGGISLQLEPYAVVRAIYPSGTAADSIIGLNSLSASPERYATARAIVEKRVLNLFGPLVLAEGGRGLIIYQPVFVANTAPNDYFGLPPNPACDFKECYENRTRWWGFSTAVLNWDKFIEQGQLFEPLELNTYAYRLERPGFSLGLPASEKGGIILAESEDRKIHYGDAVSVPILLPGDTVWTLYVSLGSSSPVDWAGPVIAGVVIASFLVTLLVVTVLMQIEKHQGLLQRLLPKKVLRKLELNEIFLEKFPLVSVLFTDIKGFTTLSHQLQPIEVVELLNRQNDAFEILCAKHGVYKLDVIGDSLFAVAGCPVRMDPHLAAKKAALLAFDLIDAIASIRLESHPELRIEIRCGINSGPIFAHTIGRVAPRFTILGQTVNIASRMESTGSPSRLHVSRQTAMLLNAFDEDFKLLTRGNIDVKGVGSMETFWVERLRAQQASLVIENVPAPVKTDPELVIERTKSNLSRLHDSEVTRGLKPVVIPSLPSMTRSVHFTDSPVATNNNSIDLELGTLAPRVPSVLPSGHSKGELHARLAAQSIKEQDESRPETDSGRKSVSDLF